MEEKLWGSLAFKVIPSRHALSGAIPWAGAPPTVVPCTGDAVRQGPSTPSLLLEMREGGRKLSARDT